MLESLWEHNPDEDMHVYLIYDNVDSHKLSLAAGYLHSFLPGLSLMQASAKPLTGLKQWRRSDLLERGRRFATENPGRLRHWDQDVLNHVFEADWLPLPDRWNACPHLFGLCRDYDAIG